mmetsp:Transcript_6363/g.16530  ORF Transcript_6363/g.16530 Transcript_6363/m.16530 type:complete len:201 (+) Transcript_6363:1673-2275(+)
MATHCSRSHSIGASPSPQPSCAATYPSSNVDSIGLMRPSISQPYPLSDGKPCALEWASQASKKRSSAIATRSTRLAAVARPTSSFAPVFDELPPSPPLLVLPTQRGSVRSNSSAHFSGRNSTLRPKRPATCVTISSWRPCSQRSQRQTSEISYTSSEASRSSGIARYDRQRMSTLGDALVSPTHRARARSGLSASSIAAA